MPYQQLPVTPYNPPDPLAAVGRVQALKNQQMQGQLQGQQLANEQLQNQSDTLKLQEQRSSLAEHDAAMQAIKESGGDIRKALPKIMQVAPNAGIAYQKAIDEWEKADLDKKKSILEVHQKQSERLGQLAGSVKDEPTKMAALQAAVNEGVLEPQTAQELAAKPYDPATYQAYQQQAMTAAQQTAQAQQQLTAKETNRHNQAMETKPPAEEQEFSAFYKNKLAAAGKQPNAKLEMEARNEFYKRKQSVNNIMTQSDAKDIADAIENGDQPPTLQGLYRNAGPVRAELARRGFPLAKATMDWEATKKYITTLNGSQQVRLRQAISTASDSLDKIEGLYDEVQKLAPMSGFKILNRAALSAMKNLPGEAGAKATALDAQIADLTSELGNVYMGGNSPTDHALGLAQKNLSSDWNDQTFKEGLKQARLNLKIRNNSIIHALPAGTSENSPYMPQSGPKAGTVEGGYRFKGGDASNKANWEKVQ